MSSVCKGSQKKKMFQVSILLSELIKSDHVRGSSSSSREQTLHCHQNYAYMYMKQQFKENLEQAVKRLPFNRKLSNLSKTILGEKQQIEKNRIESIKKANLQNLTLKTSDSTPKHLQENIDFLTKLEDRRIRALGR